MKKINSYIFLKNNEDKIKKDKFGNYELNLKSKAFSIFKDLYNVYTDDIMIGELENPTKETEKRLEKMVQGIKHGGFKITLDEITKDVEFKLSTADSTEYLDIIVEDKIEANTIKFMENIHNTIISDNSPFNKDYITIISYDSISEYYCNKSYPLLNRFERKFRKLLYLTYTSQFKKAYFEITTSKEFQDKVKTNVQSKNEDYRIRNYWYSLEFNTLKQLLFEKNWTSYDEQQLNKYLNSHKKLNELSDEELKAKMLSIKPTNDWERLFSNKGLNDNLENIITDIGKLRNLVAHNKLMAKEQFIKLEQLLKCSITTIDNAVKVTETVDFKNINNEKMNEIVEGLRNALSLIGKKVTKCVSEFTRNIMINEENNIFAKLGKLAIDINDIDE